MKPRPLENKPNGKCRRWELRASAGFNPETGHYRERTKRFRGTYREALEENRIFAASVSSSVPSKTFSGTFSDACRIWIAQREQMHLIAPSTARKQHFQLQSICHHIGTVPLAKVSTAHINAALASMMAGEHGISGTYAHQVLSDVKAVFKWAKNLGYVSDNPAEAAFSPKNDTKERPMLTEAQVTALIAATPPEDARFVAIRLALMAGLRLSECFALRWSEVDFSKKTLCVPGTKTASSRATVPMADALCDYLLSWQVQQAADNFLKNRKTDLVLGDYKIQAFKSWFKRSKGELGLDGYHFHDLRHGFATTLARAGVHPKAIQTLMRHADDRMAMKIYTHVNEEDMRSALKGVF